MELLNRLTIKNLKLNKKRTAVTIIGIILATALITGVTTLISSFQATAIEESKRSSGDYHYCFKNVTNDDLKYITNNRNIEETYLTQNIGYSILKDSKNEDKPYLFLSAFDEKALKNLNIELINGRLPENENEIIISKHIETNGQVKYNIGDELNLEIGKRMVDEDELDQSNPYINVTNGNANNVIDDEKNNIEDNDIAKNSDEKEIFIPQYTKRYKIVGIIERPSYNFESYSSPGYTIITKLEKMSESNNINIYTKYKNLKKKDETTQSILGLTDEGFEEYKKGNLSAKYDIETNDGLISWETLNFSDGTNAMLYIVGAIVILIIIVSSVFCIRNSFSISITEKVQQYGMLASIGATPKQIKKNVLYEGLILGVVGIPLGILSGIFAIFILLKIVEKILTNTYLGMSIIFSINIFGIILSIILSSITIYLSAKKSAKRASKISPIEAIKSTQDIKIKSKKLKTPILIKKLFGIGGELSYKNLKRNNKKYRTTIISITISVAIFISMTSFTNYAFKASSIYYTDYSYNLSVRSFDMQNDYKKFQEIAKSDLVNSYAIIREMSFNVKTSELEKNFSKKVKDDLGIIYEKDSENQKETSLLASSLGDEEYKRYLKELGLDYNECKNKIILIDNVVEYMQVDGKSSYQMYHIYDYQKGNTMSIKLEDNTELNLEIAAVTDKRPKGLENTYSMYGSIVISDELLEKHSENILKSIALIVDSSNPDELESFINKNYPNTFSNYINNISKEVNAEKSMWLVISIFLYGFIAVISLIGITNIFNTITTNMELRQKEFANLKSIGMTKKEFNRMIRLESILYCVKSLIFGIAFGLVLSVLIYKAFGINTSMPYTLPISGIIISIIAVSILIGTIMKYSLNKINKQNIIETIRKDNI